VIRSRLFLLVGGVTAILPVTLGSRPATARAPSEPAVINQQVPIDPQQVAELVGRLGDSSYRVREGATRALTKVGVPAKAELLKAIVAPDAEVRYRARLVLSEVLDVDFKQRLNAFIEDARGECEHDLPGWSRFRTQQGDGAAARRLFAEMQRNEPLLMEASELGSLHASTAFDARCQQIQESLRVPGRQAERQVPLGTVAALLFVGADGNVPVSMQSAMCVTNFCYQQPFRHSIDSGDTMPVLKRLVGGWVRRDFANDSTAAYQTMMLALQFNVREGVEPALTMLKDGSGNPHMRQYALLVVGKFGGPDDINRLEPLLADEAICAQQQIAAPATEAAKNDPAHPQPPKHEIVETQIRDVALAVMLHLSGQKLADYGFSRAQPNSTILFNTASLGFTGAPQRDAAIAKWRQSRTAQSSPK
jgi:hypothetical protein